MIICNKDFIKEAVADYYTADSIILLTREGSSKVDGNYVCFNKTDAASVLSNKADHRFVVQLLTGNHKGEMYGLRYIKSTHDDGILLSYSISQNKLLAGTDKLPQELTQLIQKYQGNDVIATRDIKKYIETINNQSLNDTLSKQSQSQPE